MASIGDTPRTSLKSILEAVLLAAGEPLARSFCKLIGLGGFIIGESEEVVRRKMEELAVEAERIKTEVPQHFPAQYL